MHFLEIIAQKIWPLFSSRVDNPIRCHNCLLTNINAVLDEKGICNHCSNLILTEEKENKTPIKFQGEKKILVMISGGKDSTYLIDRLTDKYPMLDFTGILVDNGFMAPDAKKNASNICRLVNVPLIIEDQHKDKFYHAFRNALLNLNKKPCYENIDRVDGDLTFKIVSDYAKIHGYRTIITGLSKEQLKRILNVDSHVYLDSNKIKVLNPLALWHTDETKIREYVLKNKLIKKAGPLATNSKLIILMAILDTKNLGYSSFEPEFASLIRYGKADREYWKNMFDFLKWATDRGYFDWIANSVLKKFDLSLKDVT